MAVIAESADVCIRTMLSRCKPFRVLSRIISALTEEKSWVLRQRCCYYLMCSMSAWANLHEMDRHIDTIQVIAPRHKQPALMTFSSVSILFSLSLPGGCITASFVQGLYGCKRRSKTLGKSSNCSCSKAVAFQSRTTLGDG